jgi:hypothetical protein
MNENSCTLGLYVFKTFLPSNTFLATYSFRDSPSKIEHPPSFKKRLTESNSLRMPTLTKIQITKNRQILVDYAPCDPTRISSLPLKAV